MAEIYADKSVDVNVSEQTGPADNSTGPKAAKYGDRVVTAEVGNEHVSESGSVSSESNVPNAEEFSDDQLVQVKVALSPPKKSALSNVADDRPFRGHDPAIDNDNLSIDDDNTVFSNRNMPVDNRKALAKRGQPDKTEESHNPTLLNYDELGGKRDVSSWGSERYAVSPRRKPRKRVKNRRASDTDSERDVAGDRPGFFKRIRQPVARQEAAGSDAEQDETLIKPTDIKIHSGPKRVFAKKVGAWAGSGFLGLGVVGGAVGATSIGAAGFGAKFGAVVGTVLCPGLGTAAGIAGGAVIGAGVGLVGGLLVGAVRGYLRSQKGHIDAGMQRFQDQGYELSQDEADRLQDPKIKPDTWANLLRVPGKGTLSKDLRVADERDRELIRNAILMTVMKTDGNARQRVREAFAVKQRLMRPLPWDASRRGFEIVDHGMAWHLEPDRLDETFDTDHLKCKLQNLANGQRAREAFDFLERKGWLDAADKRALLDCQDDILNSVLDFQPPRSLEGDPRVKEDCGNIAAAMLLCLAADTQSNRRDGSRNWQASRVTAFTLCTELRRDHELNLPRGIGDTTPMARCFALRTNETYTSDKVWQQLKDGRVDSIDFGATTHQDVHARYAADLKAFLKALPQGGRFKEQFWDYAHVALDEVDRTLFDNLPKITPEDRYQALREVISKIRDWYLDGNLDEILDRNYHDAPDGTMEKEWAEDVASRLAKARLKSRALKRAFQPQIAKKELRLQSEISDALDVRNAGAPGIQKIAPYFRSKKQSALWHLARPWIKDNPGGRLYTGRLKEIVRDLANSDDDALHEKGARMLVEFAAQLGNMTAVEVGLTDEMVDSAAQTTLEKFDEMENEAKEPVNEVIEEVEQNAGAVEPGSNVDLP